MKRSHAVVAVLAAATVGGAAYSMMPSETCHRVDGGASLDPASPACRVGGVGGMSSGYHSSRSFFGSSDKDGAYPVDHPTSPESLAATLYHALGIDPGLRLRDPEGREVSVVDGGRPVLEIFG